MITYDNLLSYMKTCDECDIYANVSLSITSFIQILGIFGGGVRRGLLISAKPGEWAASFSEASGTGYFFQGYFGNGLLLFREALGIGRFF